MAHMSAALPFHLAPPTGIVIGPAVTLVEGEEGSYVLIRGEVTHSWAAEDELMRRLAATQLVELKAGTNIVIAAAFKITVQTLWLWCRQRSELGLGALIKEKPGPRNGSRLFTPETLEQIRELHESGLSMVRISQAVGMSDTSVARALKMIATEQATQPAPEPATAPATVQPELPILPPAADRSADRTAARRGEITHATPVFEPAARVPMLGYLLALPALESTGLLTCAAQVYGSLPNGFYGLETLLLEGVLRNLAREPRTQGATRINPVDFGRILGLDRAPEVKTLRTKYHHLAEQNKGQDLIQALAAHHLAGCQEDALAILYVDGHVRAYQGQKKIQKAHSNRLQFPAPATVETWVSDAAGDPVMMVMAEPAAALTTELGNLLPLLREAIGDDRRVLVGFDRGGWSPALFQKMSGAGFDVLTWRKGSTPDITPGEKFTLVDYVDEAGLTHRWMAADTTVEVKTDQKCGVFTMRQISQEVLTPSTGQIRQIHVLTTRTDLPIGEVLFRMGARWRIENYFRYARMHFALDSHPAYATTDDDEQRTVPNPAKKHTLEQVGAARSALDRAESLSQSLLLSAYSPPPNGGPVIIDSAQHTAMSAPARAARKALDAAMTANQQTPARMRLGELNPGQQVAEVQVKLLAHALGMAAFNTEMALARDIRLNTGYKRAAEEAHALVRAAFNASGDIDPTVNGVLSVSLDPLPTRRETAAVAELCEHLTATQTVYPGTDRVLRFSVKPG